MTPRYRASYPGWHAWTAGFQHGFREKSIRRRFFYPNARPDDVFVDVGAAYGSWSLPARSLCGYVVACEPRREIAGMLAANLARNGDNWTVVPSAVGAVRQDAVQMCISGVSSTVAAGQTAVACRSHRMVGLTTIDDIAAQYRLGRVDWLKVDAEGAEMDVLEGARETIKAHIPNLIVECHARHGSTTLQDVIRFATSAQPSYVLAAARPFGIAARDRPHVVLLRPGLTVISVPPRPSAGWRL